MQISRRHALGMIGATLAFPGALLGGVTEAAAATITPLGAAFRLDGNQTGGQRRPRLSAFTDGRFLATWTQDPPATDETGWRRAFTVNGAPLTAPLAGIPPRINSAVPVCFGNTTSLLVGSYKPTADGFRILARAYNANFAVTATTGVYVPPVGTLGEFAVKACRLTNGLVLAAWTHQQSISTMSAIGVILDAGAVVHGGIKQLTNGAETAEQPQAVAALTGGGAAIAYTASTSFRTYTDLMVQRLGGLGSRLGAPIRLARYPTPSLVKSIGLIGTSAGGFLAMWSESDSAGGSRLRWQVYNAAGVKVQNLYAINGVAGSVDAGAVLARMPNGKMVAITAAVTGAAGPNRRYNVFAWNLLATGVLALAPVAIFTNTVASHFPGAITALNVNTVMACFTGGGTDASTTHRAMARRLQVT